MISILNKAIVELLFTRLTVLIALGIMIFTSLFTPGGRLADLDVTLRFAINAFNLSLYYSATYLLLGRYLAWGLQRYWPWYYLQLLFYLPLAAATGLLDAALTGPAFGWDMAAWSMTSSMAMVALAVTIVLLTFRSIIDAILVKIERPGCLFRSVRPPEETLMDRLPAEKRGALLLLRSANQYVEVVTDKGSELLRMPLKDAENMVPPERGLRIHRSVWIAFDHVADVSNERGKLVVTDKSGETFNVSRSASDMVLETLQARGL